LANEFFLSFSILSLIFFSGDRLFFKTSFIEWQCQMGFDFLIQRMPNGHSFPVNVAEIEKMMLGVDRILVLELFDAMDDFLPTSVNQCGKFSGWQSRKQTLISRFIFNNQVKLCLLCHQLGMDGKHQRVGNRDDVKRMKESDTLQQLFSPFFSEPFFILDQFKTALRCRNGLFRKTKCFYVFIDFDEIRKIVPPNGKIFFVIFIKVYGWMELVAIMLNLLMETGLKQTFIDPVLKGERWISCRSSFRLHHLQNAFLFQLQNKAGIFFVCMKEIPHDCFQCG